MERVAGTSEEEIEKIKKNPKIKKIFLVGISMGGNLALLASIKKKVDGVILVGTPVHLKNHFWIWLGVWIVPFFFKKNIQKKYPAGVNSDFLKKTSYRYFPIKSVRESLRCIRAALFSLKKVTVPLLILQSSSDYLVAKYSPWVIFNGASSRIKKMYWIKSKKNSHVLLDSEMTGAFSIIETFIKLVLKESKNNFLRKLKMKIGFLLIPICRFLMDPPIPSEFFGVVLKNGPSGNCFCSKVQRL